MCYSSMIYQTKYFALNRKCLNFVNKKDMGRRFEILKFLLVGVICMLLGCKDDNNVSMPQSFQRAMEEIDSNPHKTADYLDLMADDTLKMNKAERMFYNLYSLYAHDKLGKGVMTVEKTGRMVDYYSRFGVDSLYMLSLYLHAGAYRDANNMPQAVDWYLKAISYGKSHFSSNRFLERSFGQLAYCYNEVFLPEKALDVLRESEKYVRGPYLAQIYHRMSQIYSNLEQIDSSRVYLLKSMSVVPKGEEGIWAAQNIQFFIEQKDTANVLRYKDFLLAVDEENEGPMFAVSYGLDKAMYYDFVQNSDSATYYFEKVIGCNSKLLASHEAAKHLYELYHRKNDDAKAWKYVKMYQHFTDSLMRTTESQQVSQVDEMYEYQQHLKNINEKLESSNLRLRLAIICVILLLVILAVSFIWVRNYRRTSNRLLASSLEQSEKVMQRNEELNKRIKEENKTFEQARKEAETLEHTLADVTHQRNAAEEKIKELSMQLETNLAMSTHEHMGALEHLTAKLNLQETALTAEQWAKTASTINVVYIQLNDNLAKYIPQADFFNRQILYLSCLTLSGSRIAILTGLLPQSVSARKNRMVERTQKIHPELKITNFADLVSLLHGKRKYK